MAQMQQSVKEEHETRNGSCRRRRSNSPQIIHAHTKRGREEEDLNEGVSFAIIHFQDRCHVSTSITVIRRTENSDNLLLLSKEDLQKDTLVKIQVNNHINKPLRHPREYCTWPQLNPSITSWCALAISFKLLVWLNCSEISCQVPEIIHLTLE